MEGVVVVVVVVLVDTAMYLVTVTVDLAVVADIHNRRLPHCQQETANALTVMTKIHALMTHVKMEYVSINQRTAMTETPAPLIPVWMEDV